MIAKTGTGKGFGGLMEYLREEKKFGWMQTRNVTSLEPGDIAREMQIYSMESRAKKPVYHVTISWHPEDQPTREEMVEVGDQFLEHMKLEGHQAVMISHQDGDHPHLHLMINRVNPETGKAWEPYEYEGEGRGRKIVRSEYENIESFLRVIEKEKGWVEVPGKHTDHGKDDDFESPAPEVWEVRRERQLREKAAAMGLDPESIDPRSPKQKVMEIKEGLFQARSFEEFDGKLAGQGLWLEKKGQGGVITDGYLSVKLSTLSRSLSTGRLQEKYGQKLDDYISNREHGIRPEQGRREASRALKLAFDIELNRSETITNHQIRLITNELTTLHTSAQVDKINRDIREAFQGGFEDGYQSYTVFLRYAKRLGLERAYQDITKNPEIFGEIKDKTQCHMLTNHLRSFREINDQANHHIGDLLASDRKQRLLKKKKHYQNAYASIIDQAASAGKQAVRIPAAVLQESEAGRDILQAKAKTDHAIHRVRHVIAFHRAFKESITTPGTTLSKQIAKTIGGPKTRIALKVLESSSKQILQAAKTKERSR